MPLTNAPIIDSHIHLYAETHLAGLNWTADLPSSHILNRQKSIHQYRDAIGDNQNVRGFVFVETDRKFGHDEPGWQGPLEEVSFLARIANGRPVEGEGHSAADSNLLLGMVPWAPLPAGPAALERYVTKVRQACGEGPAYSRVKGFRYLVQDKPAGTMVQPQFVSGLKWLGDQGFVFDLGVDSRGRGVDQLREAVTMLAKVFEDNKNLKVVINHFCKPNLHLPATEVVRHEDFTTWKECIMAFASYPTTYMKLSGFFSELPSQDERSPTAITKLLEECKPWVDVVFEAFGPSRIMFGSDWPVCSVGGPGSKSWQHWVSLVAAMLDERGLGDEEKRRIWAGTASEAYNLDVAPI